jgi:hypothetical protein
LVLQYPSGAVQSEQPWAEKGDSGLRRNWKKNAMSKSKFVYATFICLVALVLMSIGILSLNGQAPAKTYKHASQYQVAILDQNLRVATGSDVTLGKNTTDAKLGSGGQGIHLLHTDSGNFRVEAPVNKGRSFGLAMATAMANSDRPAWAQQQSATIHNQWFLDNVQSGTKVLFASECANPNKKHPNDAVRCTFWFPDPDSSDHEYETLGDFTPFSAGDGSNTQKTANTLCGKGKLSPAVEAQVCPSVTGSTGAAPVPVTPPAPVAIQSPVATPAPAATVAPATTFLSVATPAPAAAPIPAASRIPSVTPTPVTQPAATTPAQAASQAQARALAKAAATAQAQAKAAAYAAAHAQSK